MSKSIWLALVLLVLGAGAAAVASKPQARTEGFFNCKIVQCAAPQCEYGEHLQVPPGECCPVCVPD